MHRNALMLCLMLCLLLGVSRSVVADAPVVAADLASLKLPGKVDVVLWTRRADAYTLQIVMPRTPTAGAARPRVEAWLLDADDRVIRPVRRWETPPEPKACVRCLAIEVQYTFPRTSADKAMSAALRVDEVVRRAPLERFAD